MRPLDGGFESGGTGTPWQLGGLAAFAGDFSGEPVHTGAFSMKLANDTVTGSVLIQGIATTPGEQLLIAEWVNADLITPSTVLECFVYYDLEGANGFLLETLTEAEIGSGWVPHILPPFVADASQVFLVWMVAAPGGGPPGAWFLDDIQVVGDNDVAKRSRWLSHQRLVTILKGINGAPGGYHLDLGSRVFTKYVLPLGSTHPAFPYICIPLVHSAPQIEHDATWLRCTWTLPIMCFVAEPNVGALDSDAHALLYHLIEDVWQAVMRDPYLNNTVASTTFLSNPIEESGISPFDGMQFANAIIPLQLSQVFGLDVLGP